MKKSLTAEELHEQSLRDPKFQAMMAEINRKHEEREVFFKKDQKELIEALTKAGWPANVRQCGPNRSVWDPEFSEIHDDLKRLEKAVSKRKNKTVKPKKP